MLTILNIFLYASGAAFWLFTLWVFFGVQRSLLFSKQFKFLGYAISIDSQMKKDLTVKIHKD